ncbi:MAG TPA: hypothetical protein DEO86_07510 [Colwellia sp.]|nr:hypothetical protein [Colwellia sp.]
MNLIDKYFVTSLIIWVVATIESLGGLAGYWSITGNERFSILFVESAILVALFANCFAIKNWVYRHSSETTHRVIAWIAIIALALCICGDVVNFNLPLTYYRYGGIVKHDYLADSVTYFAPGYALFLTIACWLAISNGTKPKVIYSWGVIAILLGVASFISMHLSGTGKHVSLVTGGYAVLITLVGASGLVLLAAFHNSVFKRGVWLVSIGLVLAAAADGVIGQFWIYGNGGEGFFPAAKYVNWSLYIGSQCLLIHIARLAVWHKTAAITTMPKKGH